MATSRHPSTRPFSYLRFIGPNRAELTPKTLIAFFNRHGAPMYVTEEVADHQDLNSRWKNRLAYLGRYELSANEWAYQNRLCAAYQEVRELDRIVELMTSHLIGRGEAM